MVLHFVIEQVFYAMPCIVLLHMHALSYHKMWHEAALELRVVHKSEQ